MKVSTLFLWTLIIAQKYYTSGNPKYQLQTENMFYGLFLFLIVMF